MDRWKMPYSFLLLSLCLLFGASQVHRYSVEDCHTSNIDILIVFENYISEFCINQEGNAKFISEVLDVYLAPGEEQLTRLHVAVASFTSSGPVIYLPFQNSSRRDFMEKINTLKGCHSNTSPLTDTETVLENIITSINASVDQRYGNRISSRNVVVFLMHSSFPTIYDVQFLHEQCVKRKHDCGENVFFVMDFAGFASGGYIAFTRSVKTSVHSGSSSGVIFSHAACNPCAGEGMFTIGDGKDNSGQWKCFHLQQLETFTSWRNSRSLCGDRDRSDLAIIDTKENLSLLNLEIQARLQQLNLDKSQMYTIRNHHYLYIYLDSRYSQYQPTDQFPCADANSHTTYNWFTADVKYRECGAWLFKFPAQSPIFDKDNGTLFLETNASMATDQYTQGWVDIPCDNSLSKFALCITMSTVPNFPVHRTRASETSIIHAIRRGEFYILFNRITSIGVQYGGQGLQIKPDFFFTFSCIDIDGYQTEFMSSYVCDHIQNCRDGSDENICEYRSCKPSEFQCSSSSLCIPMEVVCDLIDDCEDSSDEQFCLHTCTGYRCCSGECIPQHWIGDGHIDCAGCQDTDENNDESVRAVSALNQLEQCVFICNRTQCVYPSQLNDGVVDCQGPEGPIDETIGALEHVSKCRTSNVHRINVMEWAPRCVYVRDDYGSFLGCKDKSHLQNCANFTCPEGYTKCHDSYCIPLSYVKDEVTDCPGQEDESTLSLSCEGYLICAFGCVHPDQICDGHVDCEMNVYSARNEDEVNCHVSCAAGFICVGGMVVVGNYNKTIPLRNLNFVDDRTRYLDLSGVDISYVINGGTRAQLQNLVYLVLVACNISSVEYEFAEAIGRVSSVYKMNLSYNVIEEITTDSVFRRTSNLRYLDLSYNQKLTKIVGRAFEGSHKLKQLNLSHTSIHSLHFSLFQGLLSLEVLNVSHTLIDSMQGRNFPDAFLINTLDLRGTVILNFEPDTFEGLSIESDLYTDVFSLCCPDVRGVSIPQHKCHSPRETISSCANLIGSQIQRLLLWFVGIIALLGNTVVIVYRIGWEKEIAKKPYGLFVINLGLSDLIMGVYLVIIAGADMVYKDAYVWNDRNWRLSVTCKIAGFLSTFSSETSMLFIFLVTLDRLLVIKFPFGNFGISKTHMILLTIVAWMGGFLVSIIPVLPIFEESNIYTYNALCLGLPLTTARPDGWRFSMAVFIVFNFMIFLIIAVGQVLIFRAMSSHRSAIVQSSARRAQDIEVAKQLSLVVLSDFLCWFPIGVMGLLALTGVDIGREAYGWSAVLVLPVNAAINPLLYTIPVIIDKWKKYRSGEGARNRM